MCCLLVPYCLGRSPWDVDQRYLPAGRRVSNVGANIHEGPLLCKKPLLCYKLSRMLGGIA